MRGGEGTEGQASGGGQTAEGTEARAGRGGGSGRTHPLGDGGSSFQVPAFCLLP